MQLLQHRDKIVTRTRCLLTSSVVHSGSGWSLVVRVSWFNVIVEELDRCSSLAGQVQLVSWTGAAHLVNEWRVNSCGGFCCICERGGSYLQSTFDNGRFDNFTSGINDTLVDLYVQQPTKMFQAQGRVYCAFNVCSKPLSRCTLTYKWCEQVGTATSTTTPWGDSWGTQSCTKSAPAQVKSAGSLLDEPSTPCTNKQDRGWWLLKRPYEWSAADEQLLTPSALYGVMCCCVRMVLDCLMFQNHCHIGFEWICRDTRIYIVHEITQMTVMWQVSSTLNCFVFHIGLILMSVFTF